MDTVEVLTQVRQFLSNPYNWVKGTMNYGSAKCLVAAIYDTLDCRDGTHPVFKALQSNSDSSDYPTSVHLIAGINDKGTHEELLAWLDHTIVAEKAKRGVEALKNEIRNVPITEVVEPKTEMLVH